MRAVVVAAKTTSDATKCSPFPPDPNSSASTINTVAREITEAGGIATAIAVDVRDFASIEALVTATVSAYGRLDVLVYNSGAIWWSSVEKTPMKRFQLMQQVNPEGLYGSVQACLPHLYKSRRARIIVVSPPIYSRFFRGKTAYAMGKVGMSVLTMGLPMDWKREGRDHMAITSIWPAAVSHFVATGTDPADESLQAIESAATESHKADKSELRKPTIFSDAIIAILNSPPEDVTGQCFLDEDFLREHENIQNFEKYSVVPGSSPRRIMPAKCPDLRVAEQDDEGNRMDSTTARASKI